MALFLKQSTAVDILIGPFVDRDDGYTAEVSAFADGAGVKLSKNGQTLALKNDATTPVHDADGYYNCELDATDTNTIGQLVVEIAASAMSALPVRHEFFVVEENIYESLFATNAAGFDASARVDVGSWLGTAVTLSSADSKPDVNVYAIGESSAAAANLERGARALVLGAVSGASSTTTVLHTTLSEATNDHYNGRIVTFTTGALAGQATDITDYTTGTLTVTALTEAPSAGDLFVIS